MTISPSEQFEKNKIIFSVCIFLLLLISLFLNLGVHPLYLEEPRRALIALEMIYNKNIIVPTEFGEYYYKKPPLYNWMIILAYKIFGTYSEFATRFFSVLSFIGMGVTLYWIGKKYVNETFGIVSSLCFLVSIDIYYYFSILAEIDVFYSFITLLSFFSIFHFYQKKQLFLLFVFTYSLGALGTLTKGFPSVVFLSISLPVFFIYNKDFKKLFSLYHFAGIFIYILIVAGYFFIYSEYNGLEGYFRDLWSQSSERTLLEKSILSLIVHLIPFPLEVLKNTLPASLFIIFIIRRDWLKEIRRNKLIEFCFYLFVSNSLIYWLSPGSRARYVYMLYPLFIMVMTYFYLISENAQRKKAFEIVAGVLIALCALGCAAVPFIPQFRSLSSINYIAVSGLISIVILLVFYVKRSSFRLLYLILCLVLMRFVFNYTVIPSRAQPDQQAQMEENDALRMSKIVKNSPLYIFNGINMSHTIIFYLEKEIKKVVGYKSEQNTEDFFIVSPDQLSDKVFKVYHEFYLGKEKRLLVKFLK